MVSDPTGSRCADRLVDCHDAGARLDSVENAAQRRRVEIDRQRAIEDSGEINPMRRRDIVRRRRPVTRDRMEVAQERGPELYTRDQPPHGRSGRSLSLFGAASGVATGVGGAIAAGDVSDGRGREPLDALDALGRDET